nr:Chain C, LEU-LEU-LEU-GLY-ILE-GLY-ILE-LEU-VAL [Homo sapiens]7ZUC_F Chain F, LEU-LEU-LEU-GLY-ILE-GLY-ILE-LEU-VAL [Homo sapiens]
LLLGIGILV